MKLETPVPIPVLPILQSIRSGLNEPSSFKCKNLSKWHYLVLSGTSAALPQHYSRGSDSISNTARGSSVREWDTKLFHSLNNFQNCDKEIITNVNFQHLKHNSV